MLLCAKFKAQIEHLKDLKALNKYQLHVRYCNKYK